MNKRRPPKWLLACAVLWAMMLGFKSVVALSAPLDPQHFGQGPNPWCFAFAENQFLKTQICPTCADLPDSWNLSIFDIMRIHTAKDAELEGRPFTPKEMVKGSSLSLPYPKGTRLRDGACTLERELFLMNRSREMNASQADMVSWLEIQYVFVLAYGTLEPDVLAKKLDGESSSYFAGQIEFVRRNNLKHILAKLTELAKTTPAGQFVSAVMDESTCDRTVEVPRRAKNLRLVTDEALVEPLLRQGLRESRAVLLALCSDELKEAPRIDGCDAHAVTALAMSKDKVLIADSAFNSPRQPERDGTTWIDRERLVTAIVRFGRRIQQNRDEMESGLSKSKMLADSIRNKYSDPDFLADQMLELVTKEFGTKINRFSGWQVRLMAAFIAMGIDLKTTDALALRHARFNAAARILLTDIRSAKDVSKVRPILAELIRQYPYQVDFSKMDESMQAWNLLRDRHLSWPTHNVVW